MKKIFSRYVESRTRREIHDFKDNGIGKTVGFQPSANQAKPINKANVKASANQKRTKL